MWFHSPPLSGPRHLVNFLPRKEHNCPSCDILCPNIYNILSIRDNWCDMLYIKCILYIWCTIMQYSPKISNGFSSTNTCTPPLNSEWRDCSASRELSAWQGNWHLCTSDTRKVWNWEYTRIWDLDMHQLSGCNRATKTETKPSLVVLPGSGPVIFP